MFNDFKILNFKVTKQKIAKLFDIFKRLGLSSLEERCNGLNTNLDLINTKLLSLTESVTKKIEANPHWPSITPPIVPEEPTPPESTIIIEPIYPPDGYRYLIIHAHNPERFEIGPLDVSMLPTLYLNNIGFCNSPALLNQHNKKIFINEFIYGLPPYSFKCVFNGITVDLGFIDIPINSVAIITCVFPRTDAPLEINYTCDASLTDFPNFFGSPTYEDYTNTSSTFPLQAISAKYHHPFQQTLGYGQLSSYLNLEAFYMMLSATVTNSIGYLRTKRGIYFNDIIPDILINIPIQSFTNWYCQSLKSDKYPHLQLRTITTGYTVISGNFTSYQIERISANQTYITAKFQSRTDWPLQAYADISTGWVDTKIISGTLLNGGFKMSSIPYDLIGNAF